MSLAAVPPHQAYNDAHSAPIGRNPNPGVELGVGHGRDPNGPPTVQQRAGDFRMNLPGPTLAVGTTTAGMQVSQHIPTAQILRELRNTDHHNEIFVEQINTKMLALISATFPVRMVDMKAQVVSRLTINEAFIQSYAEYGHPGMMSFKRTSRTFNLTHGGIGFGMEWNLAQSPEGVEILLSYYQNLSTAFVRYLADQIIGFLVRLKTPRPYPLLELKGQDDLLIERANFFAIMTKLDDGITRAVRRGADIISQATRAPVDLSDYSLVVPEELLHAFSESSRRRFEVLQPDLKGDAARGILSTLCGHIPVVTYPTTLVQGVRVQPLVSNVTIGSYAIMSPNALHGAIVAGHVETLASRSVIVQDFSGHGQPMVVSISDACKSAFAALQAVPNANLLQLFVGAPGGVVTTAKTAMDGAGNWTLDRFTTLYKALVTFFTNQNHDVDIDTNIPAGTTLPPQALARTTTWVDVGNAIVQVIHHRHKRDFLTYGFVRPFVKWAMANAILVPRGGAGYTGVMNPNIQSSVDTTQKDIFWHATFYSGVVCDKVEQITTLRNLAPTAYVSGGSLTFYPQTAPEVADTFGFIVHHEDTRLIKRKPFDITGQFAPPAQGAANALPHYKFYPVLAAANTWNRASTADGEKAEYNTVVFPESVHIATVDVVGNVNPTGRFEGGTGHWGAYKPSLMFTSTVINKPGPDYKGLVNISATNDSVAPPIAFIA